VIAVAGGDAAAAGSFLAALSVEDASLQLVCEESPEPFTVEQ
jgi:hypothetical protein